jgi:hypothetical protein
MLDSENIKGLVSLKGSAPSKAPEDAEAYCIDCFNEFGTKRQLPDGWWGEKRRIQIGSVWFALCHNHFDKRQREKIQQASRPRFK